MTKTHVHKNRRAGTQGIASSTGKIVGGCAVLPESYEGLRPRGLPAGSADKRPIALIACGRKFLPQQRVQGATWARITAARNS
eukprot:3560644-Rhodomonas_salina.2